MSYDVLAALLRRLVAPGGVALSERPSEDTPGPGGDAAGALRADGGERVERDAEGDDADDDAHLRDLPDGAGCAEIWEHLSEHHAGERRSEEGRPMECRADD